MPAFDSVAKPKIDYRDLLDVGALRKSIFERVQNEFASKVIEDDDFRMEFADLSYRQPKAFTKKDEKAAVMGRRRLYHALQGRLRLIDKKTGQVVTEDKKPRSIAHVPYVNSQGLFINNGSQYLVSNQARLKPGAYTRRKDNGDLETQFNVRPGSGRAFRVHLEPRSGLFRMRVGQGEIKLYPLLKDMGIRDEQLAKVWGKDLLALNKAADDKEDNRISTRKVLDRLGRHADKVGAANSDQVRQAVANIFARMEVDPQVMQRTMGKADKAVTVDSLLTATKKMLDINNGLAEPDDREAMPFQQILTPDDFFAEHIAKDAGQLQRAAFNKLKYHKDSAKIPNNFFGKQMQSVLLSSRLANPLTQVNPVEILDQRRKVIRTGEGGIGNMQSVTGEMRNIHPTHFGFIDPVRAPESEKIGLDMRLATGVTKGSDGKLYQTVREPITGKMKKMSVDNFYDNAVAFPGEFERKDYFTGRPTKMVRAMHKGRMRYVPRHLVSYELPSSANMFTEGTNFVPLVGSGKGQRTLMGARMQSQALPVRNPEAPLVQTQYPGSTESFNMRHGRDMGAVFADQGGQVVGVSNDGIKVRQPDGNVVEHELYNYMPYNQKTLINNTPLVQKGDVVKPGQLLAKSNYTNDQGHLALGKNALIAYHMMEGLTHEDAIAVSESAAKKFASEQLYNSVVERGDRVSDIDKNKFISKYPSRFDKRQLGAIGKDGVVKVGTIVKPGDPLVLAMGKQGDRVRGSLMKGAKSAFKDAAETWDHHAAGVVTDVDKTGKGYNVSVSSYTPLKEGDKLANNYGGKGVVARVIPDDEMPRTGEGEVLDIVLSPYGINSRTNPNQIIESSLAKVAHKTGKPYILPGMSPESMAQFAWDELQKHGLSDTETLTDPNGEREWNDVFVGRQHFFKLHHLAESKLGARGLASYTSEGLPAKGGKDGAKRMDTLGVFALLSHGATDVIRDAKLRRGQKNDDYWKLYKLGMHPPEPRVSKAYEKFENHLLASGVNLRKKGNRTQVLPMTDEDVDAMAGKRYITEADTVDFNTMENVKGGLFDVGLTGGQDGTKWSAIKLAEPMPNPIMEDPIKLMLGMTEKQYRKVLGGEEEIAGRTGGEAISYALGKINIKQQIEEAKEYLRSGRRTNRDKAAKKIGVLNSLQKMGMRPEELMMTKVPVLPPKFRPISKMEGTQLVADANYLYKDLMEANTNVKEFSKTFGDAGQTRLDLYDAFKAVSGMGHPVSKEGQDRNLRGILSQVFGASPKFGMFQRKVLSTNVDMVGRGVIVPDPDLDVDEIGMPADMAWEQYKPHVIRGLKRDGMKASDALKAWHQRDERATKQLTKSMEKHPVLVNRAPTLHKFNYTGHVPKIVPGDAIRLPIPILAGHGADFDGDTANVHVVSGDDAIKQVKDKMMPSKMLWSPKTGGPQMKPDQGFVAGLYLSSTGDSGKMPKAFPSKKAALEAYKRGEIDIDDQVVIGG